MGYKTIDEMKAGFRHFTDNLEEVPMRFPVHEDYLIDGMTAADFASGYRAYRALMVRFQEAMLESLDEYGLVAADKKGAMKPIVQMNYPLLWLFMVWSMAGEVRDGVLYVNRELYDAYLGGKKIGSHTAIPKNIPQVLAHLDGFGVYVRGMENGDFTVSTDDPNLIRAAKASTLSPYCPASMHSDYYAFNWRIYRYARSVKKIPLEATVTVQRMPEEQRALMFGLIGALAENGFRTYKFRHHHVECGWLHFGCMELYYGYDRPLTILIAPWNLHRHHEYVEGLPERYRNIWENTNRCHGCRKGECRSRYVGELFGKNGAWCSGQKPAYPLTSEEDIQYAIEAAVTLKDECKSNKKSTQTLLFYPV